MKGNPKIIATLDALLATELSAINQYIVHANMLENWGYDALSEYVMDRAATEMVHTDKLIERILFLEGTPTVTSPPKVQIGASADKMLAVDKGAEITAIIAYNAAVSLCEAEKDDATRKLLSKILKDEDQHLNDIEAYLAQISQMGLGIFLSTQN